MTKPASYAIRHRLRHQHDNEIAEISVLDVRLLCNEVERLSVRNAKLERVRVAVLRCNAGLGSLMDLEKELAACDSDKDPK